MTQDRDLQDKIVGAIVQKVEDEHLLALLEQERREAAKAMLPDEVEIRVKPSKENKRALTASDAAIIAAIRDKAPDTISNTIHFFPLGRYLFITDKEHPYNLPLIDNYTPDEMARIHALRYEMMQKFRLATTDEDKVAYEDYKAECEKELESLNNTRKERAYIRVKPLKSNKQIRIYIRYSDKAEIEDLGYKVLEQEQEYSYAIWDDDKQAYEKDSSKHLSLSFMMNYRAFITACKFCKIPHKGYYIDEDGVEVKIKQSGVKERIRVRDAQGVIREFASKSEAARDLGISPALLSKLIKANPDAEILEVKVGAKDNRKALVLITHEGERLEFDSVRDCASKLGVDKMKVSRGIKGKQSGDKITLAGVNYRLG